MVFGPDKQTIFILILIKKKKKGAPGLGLESCPNAVNDYSSNSLYNDSKCPLGKTRESKWSLSVYSFCVNLFPFYFYKEKPVLMRKELTSLILV
jgi:hypothetical protein